MKQTRDLISFAMSKNRSLSENTICLDTNTLQEITLAKTYSDVLNIRTTLKLPINKELFTETAISLFIKVAK